MNDKLNRFLTRSIRNRIGLWCVTLFWLGLAILNSGNVLQGIRFRGIRFSGGDFGQYYMGGVVANEGLWEDLFPTDISSAPSPDKTSISPRLSAEMSKRGADTSWKYIYPPPLAVFLAPLDWMPFSVSRKVFSGLLFASVIWFLVLLQKECDDWNLPLWLTNLLVLAIGTGLPVCESVMMSNATPFMGLASLLVMRSLRSNRVFGSVFSFALAGLFKGISVVWIPTLLLWKHWKIVVAGFLSLALILALPHILGASFEIWGQFVNEVVPGSRKLYWIGDGNLGLPSFCAWFFGSSLPPTMKRTLDISLFVVLALAYAFAWRLSRRDFSRSEGLVLFVSTVAFQVFSPICWPHYAFNVVGFLPLALSVSGVQKGVRLHGIQWISVVVIGLAFVLAWFPVGNVLKYVFHAPILGFGRLFGHLLMIGWGTVALAKRSLHHE